MKKEFVSVIVPVFHEPGIATFIESLWTHLDAHAEVIVVDGAADLDTLARLSSSPACLCAAPAGRGVQLNYGAHVAQGEILLFLHADTILPSGALELIRQAMREPHLVGGAFTLAYDSPSFAMRCIAQAANLRTRLTRVPYGDQAIFVRADIFRRVGGFAPVPIMEDLDLMTRMRRGGYHIRVFDAPVRTSARRQESMGPWRCSLRNVWLRALYHLGVSPLRLARMYRPHAG